MKSLSERKLQILVLASKGHCDKEIAEELGIAYSTVKNIKVSLFEEIGAHNMVHAVALAISRGLIPQVEKINSDRSYP